MFTTVFVVKCLINVNILSHVFIKIVQHLRKCKLNRVYVGQ